MTNGSDDMTKAALKAFLAQIDPTVRQIKLNSIRFGKWVKGIPIHSRDTLSDQEIQLYTRSLISLFRIWRSTEMGWTALEVPAMRFTLLLTRVPPE